MSTKTEAKKFVNLHTHSHYSLLDGLPQIGDLIKRAKELDMPALALTDHGVMYGTIEFYKKCQKEGIKPIIGVEAYLALEHRTRKQSKLDDEYFHMILLAKNQEGYKNLMKLVSIAHLEGYYYKPRLDKESLKALSKGLIASTGCLAGEIPRMIMDGKDLSEIEKTLQEYVEIFGENNLFLEVQAHPNLPQQQQVNQVLKELSQKCGLRRVATLDSHYLRPEDADAQDALICVGTGKYVSDTDRLDMRGVDLSLKPAEEVYNLFAGDEEVVANSLKIAEQCNLEIEMNKRFFPNFEIPNKEDPNEHLRKLTLEGLGKRYMGKEITQEVKDRLDYELKVICDKGYATYFLVVSDFVNWMRSQGIITTTRGSAAGCMVSYCLGITNVDPIYFMLPFERFLNPFRPSAPDIDVDIADNRRDEVIDYVTQKYGADKVAQIITFGTMLARAAVRDIGRVLGVPYTKCDTVAKLIPPPKQGFPMPIKKALEMVPELKALYDSDMEVKKILDLVKKVEGSARHHSVHAAGVVIAPTPLTDYTPLQKDGDAQGVVTQYDMHACEDVGLVKMDFLGIRNLSILGNAVEIIKKKHNIDIDLDNLPLDDKKTFEHLSQGETVGVFQVGGSGMTAYLKDLKPSNIFDIMAMIALYRPGPMESIPEFIRRKHDSNLINYPDPRLTEVLKNSYGILTYQDDVLFTALEIAGYDWGEVDKLRKAIGKKIPAEMAAQEERFKKGIVDNGGTQEKAEYFWNLIKPFAAYGFNKAHAASYAMVTYQTAYMKANFPAEFMAAVLTAESHDLEKVADAVEECKKMGIKVLPPDINESFKMFAVVDDKTIRWALPAIKNVGADVVDAIVRERKENGLYSSFQDLASRLPSKALNKKGIESLICAGAFDSLGERNTLLANMEPILEAARAAARSLAEGQVSLFGTQSSANTTNTVSKMALHPSEAASKQQILDWEKELLGMYVTSHPLEEYKELFNKLTPIKNLIGLAEGTKVNFGGVLSRLHKITTRKGEAMAFLTFEDLSGQLEAICFPRLYTSSLNLLDTGKSLLAVGKISEKDGDTKVILDHLLELNEENLQNALKTQSENGNGNNNHYNSSSRNEVKKEFFPQKIMVSIPSEAGESIFTDLKTAFLEHPGDIQIVLQIPDSTGTPRQIATSYKVDLKNGLKDKIRSILSSYSKN